VLRGLDITKNPVNIFLEREIILPIVSFHDVSSGKITLA
jgi:hypothetical protein